jgi:6-phosphogluconolactonase
MTAMPGADVRTFPDLAALSRAAADLVLAAALTAVASDARFTLVLSGGSVPRTLYTLFAQPPWVDSMPWSLIHVFWADERCVSPDHRDSNYRLAFETFLSHVPAPPENVHRIRGEDGPDQASENYERELKRFFVSAQPAFDLVLLGAGEDGHTASLFPGSPQLRERIHLCLPVHDPGPKHSRVTLSLPVLNNAANVVFLVSGASKSDVVRELLDDRDRSGLPAAQVRPEEGKLVWMLDCDAAGKLQAASCTGDARKAGRR